MIWFIIAILFAVGYSFHEYFKYYNHRMIKKWLKNELLYGLIVFILLAFLISSLCSVIYSGPNSKTHSEYETIESYNLKPISETDYVQWCNDSSIVVLLDNGYYQTYKLDNPLIFIKTCVDNETPNVKTIKYTKFNDYRQWFILFNGIGKEIIITLPSGIYKPIT